MGGLGLDDFFICLKDILTSFSVALDIYCFAALSRCL